MGWNIFRSKKKTAPVQAKKELFADAQINQQGRQQINEGKFVITAQDNDWVEIDVTMPDTLEIKKNLDQENESFETIRTKLQAIEEELTKPLPGFSAVKGMEEHKGVVNRQTLTIIEKYNDLSLTCENALNTDQLTEEEKTRVRDIKKRIEAEREQFPEAVRRFRLMISGADEETRSRVRTYGDALRFQRGEYYDLDFKGGYKYSIGGAGTSKLFIITGQSSKDKVFFKEEEALMEKGQLPALTLQIAAGHPEIPEGFAEELSQALETDQEQKSFYSEFLHKVIFELKENQEHPDMTSHLSFTSTFPSLELIKDMYNAVDPVQKRFLRNYIVELGQKYNMSEMARRVCNIKPGSNLSRRNVASSRMATLLGMDDMVAASRNATVLHGGKVMQGNLMDEAKDTPISTVTKMKYSQKAIDQLSMLQIFDLITGQVDRHFGNWTHKADKKNKIIESIEAIDNDLSFGEIDYENLCKKRNPRAIDIYNYSLIPEDFKQKVRSLDLNNLRLEFMDVISSDEINHMIERIRYIREVFDKADKVISKIPNETERMIFQDPELRRKWVLYTMSKDKKKMEASTYMKGFNVPSPKELKADLEKALAERNLKISDRDFLYLAKR